MPYVPLVVVGEGSHFGTFPKFPIPNEPIGPIADTWLISTATQNTVQIYMMTTK